MNVPEIVPEEFSCLKPQPVTDPNLTGYEHPISKSNRRYVLGDRFHANNHPHKSPLCAYHDIDLCAQGTTIKTSYQESQNNRKNKKRLRSSCMQSIHTHIFYNFLMDFYDNEEVVKKQTEELQSKTGRKICRDKNLRFVITDIPL